MTSCASIQMADTSPQQGDRELLEACLKGDSAAWTALIVRYKRLIYSIPIKMGLSANDAADVFQSVCVKLLQGLSGLRNLDRINAWLTITTRRECWRLAARRRREHVALPVEWGDDLESVSMASSAPLADQEQQAIEQQQILREAVNALPEKCRSLIKMLFYTEDQASYAEIAQRLNIPLNSMGATRARCLGKLKKLLEGRL